MTAGEMLARRATLDDLHVLRDLWRRSNLPENELEKRLTEFQVVVQPEGQMAGAVALHMEGKEGVIHSESFASPELEGEARVQLWERVQSLARNHGLFRLWIQSPHPFWKSEGFLVPSEKERSKLPPGFGFQQTEWLALYLREETAAEVSLEKEFELFKQQQEELSRKAFRQAGVLRILIWVFSFSALVILVLLIWRLFQQMSPP
jgi:N-acetylglutamate synthase-like GNAT family acetyltransferase